MPGRLVILSGPSGVGKDTVIDEWSRINPAVQRVVAYTTRPIRETESEGVDYRFVSLERFRQMIADGAFLEHKDVFGNLYGTPKRDMEAMLAAGKVAVLKIDVQGAMAVIKVRPGVLTVFLMPPSFEELERRIRGRAADSPDVIERRLRVAREEISHSAEYAHVIVNREVGNVVATLETLIHARVDEALIRH